MSTNTNQEFSNANTLTDDLTEGSDTIDNSFASRPGPTPVPIVGDETPIEQPNDDINPDSREMLGMSYIRTINAIYWPCYNTERNEADAIDQSNILKGGRTRGAKTKGTSKSPATMSLTGPEDGTSSTR